jgi:hypothetical protein
MIRQMLDIGGQQGNLDFRRTGIGGATLVILDDLSFLFGIQSHVKTPKKYMLESSEPGILAGVMSSYNSPVEGITSTCWISPVRTSRWPRNHTEKHGQGINEQGSPGQTLSPHLTGAAQTG